jgi:anaerobic magnesium-protoporphyrin IX monomethyl ester cyclase
MTVAPLRLLFLNPPSPDGRRINRHVMDPHVSKGDYLYPPYDFLMLSGWFHPNDRYELRIMDAMAEQWSDTRTVSEVLAWRPDFILAMTAPQSYRRDLEFLEQLKTRARCPLFTAGAVEHERRGSVLEREPWIDGLLMEPTSQDLQLYLDGQPGPFETLQLRGQESVPAARHRAKFFEIPVCRHDLIDARKYSYPAMRTDRFTSILTSYGCPFTCTYCEAPGFKFTMRTPELVLRELELVKACGISEVCFKDWTFAANRKHADEILNGMIERNLGLSWFTFTRAELIDRDLARLMKRAGCTVVQMGVETVNSDILKDFKRKGDNAKIRNAFRICREEGLETLGTFILGLPGETETSIRSTVDFVLDLDPDYASFNIVTPLLGSELRRDWERKGLVDPDAFENQDSTRATLSHLDIEPQRLLAIRDQAVRRFYFRPRYVARRLRKTTSRHQLWAQARMGLSLLRQHVRLH